MDDVLAAAAAPPVGLSCGPLGAVQAADREIGRQTALRARAVAEFAASRPASADRPQGAPGAMSAERWAGRADVLRPVSEWATQELVVALSISSGAAEVLLERSLTLVHRLPGTLTALEDGVLHAGHLGPLLDHVAPIADDALRAAVEAGLLAWAAGRFTTPAQLRDKARREVLKRAARSAADDLARAVRQRGVSARPDRVEGMSVVSALLTTPEAAALMAALGACADALPEDGRTRGQKMADCLLDLVLRPTESGLPPVQVTLDVVAPLGALLGGDQPCEIDGQVVRAEMVRALLAALTGHPLVSTADGTPADSTPADTVQEDAAASDPAPAGPATVAGWELSEDEDFALWSAQLEDRILAGDFDAEPPPDAPDGNPPPRPTSTSAAPSPAPPIADGWWARADAAVDDASAAVLTAQQALGHARRLVATARRADTTDETTWATGPAGRVTAAPDALTQLHAATGRARDTLAGLLGATAGGGLADRPRLVLTDALTGALLALTDLPALHRAARSGAALTPPGATGRYRPGAALDRHLRARDRRCRFPGCRRPVPGSGELDHTTPWPTGQTNAANLTGYCTGHHRGKHQAPGWHHHMTPDGTLTVTTPTGLTATTTPPPY
ncbi:HNH endonuclease signature motif containing protein [Geodermatophilus obscurus]|uniref:HNH endonuclease signature motif containing protein n=1 Tax=Geodermatophilus obscurus TaxID=1861 RepID=UPI001FCCAEFE|nr:HNH endonuclease signature motif containing protein [Geodermatophilus obscurus]